MNPGKLNRKITIQSQTQTKNENGATQVNWTDLCKTWANIQTLRSREYYLASAISAENDLKFTIRFRNNISPDMRLIYNNRTFNIKSVQDTNEEHKELILVCSEVVDG